MPALGTDLYPASERLRGLWNDEPNTKQLIVHHTTESEAGNSNVIAYLERTQAGSYQTMHDFDGEEVRMVPDDKQAWAAMAEGNRRGLHSCSMGRAEWARHRWLEERKQLESIAIRWALWSANEGIPLRKITAAQADAGERGIVGHMDISEAFHESDHWDPGPNFPYDVVIARAQEINRMVVTPDPNPAPGGEMSTRDEVITQFMGPAPAHGWLALRPVPNEDGEVYSAFFNRLLESNEGQTIVEVLATLAFEATLRIPAYRGEKLAGLPPETVLGHAAAAHGGTRDILERLESLQRDVAAIATALNIVLPTKEN